jgi:hypothetical protein
MNFLRRLLGKGCFHHFSWPRVDGEGRHYQTCSLCGTAFEYDWELMRRTDRVIAEGVLLPPDLTHASARPAKSLLG